MELGEVVDRGVGHALLAVDLAVRLNRIARGLGVTAQLIPGCQDEVDRLHAYRLLAHAEVESFIEGLALRAADVTTTQLGHGRLTHAGHHLVVAWASTKVRTDSTKARYPYFRRDEAVSRLATDLDDFKAAIQSYDERIRNNHGLKAANVRQLLLPIGYRENHFQAGLLDKLTAFGESRGAVAHATGVVGVTVWTTGSTELGQTAALLPGLRTLETFLPILLRPI